MTAATIVAAVGIGRTKRLSTQQHLGLTTLAALLLAGHLLNRPSLTYPLDSWRMYGNATTPRFYYELVVTTSNSRRTGFPFSVLTPITPGPHDHYSTLNPISWRMVRRAAACRCSDSDWELDALISGLRRAYHQASGDDVLSLEIRATRVGASGGLGPSRMVYAWAEQPRDFTLGR